jgi:hypothetical protein
MLRALALLLWFVAPALAQIPSPPEFLGSIAGPGSVVAPTGVRFYGTDLGWTYEHHGTPWMVFGDTWPHPQSMCEPLPHNDDAQATLPAGLPSLTIDTDPDAANEFARIRLLRNGESLVMGYNKTPLTVFGDGADAVCLFGLVDPVRCRTRRGRPTCRPYDLACSQDVGVCTPETLGFGVPCDLATGAGCILGQTCAPTPTGVCIVSRRHRRARRLLERVGVEPVPGGAPPDERPAGRRAPDERVRDRRPARRAAARPPAVVREGTLTRRACSSFQHERYSLSLSPMATSAFSCGVASNRLRRARPAIPVSIESGNCSIRTLLMFTDSL